MRYSHLSIGLSVCLLFGCDAEFNTFGDPDRQDEIGDQDQIEEVSCSQEKTLIEGEAVPYLLTEAGDVLFAPRLILTEREIGAVMGFALDPDSHLWQKYGQVSFTLTADTDSQAAQRALEAQFPGQVINLLDHGSYQAVWMSGPSGEYFLDPVDGLNRVQGTVPPEDFSIYKEAPSFPAQVRFQTPCRGQREIGLSGPLVENQDPSLRVYQEGSDKHVYAYSVTLVEQLYELEAEFLAARSAQNQASVEALLRQAYMLMLAADHPKDRAALRFLGSPGDEASNLEILLEVLPTDIFSPTLYPSLASAADSEGFSEMSAWVRSQCGEYPESDYDYDQEFDQDTWDAAQEALEAAEAVFEECHDVLGEERQSFFTINSESVAIEITRCYQDEEACSYSVEVLPDHS